jgi:nitrite reductase/ring-hydroxylating ferredoxin subunit
MAMLPQRLAINLVFSVIYSIPARANMYFPYAVGTAFIVSAVLYTVKLRQRSALSPAGHRNATVLQRLVASIDRQGEYGNAVRKESPYPADWLTSHDHLALDRRAIFSKVRSLPAIVSSAFTDTPKQTPVPLAHASQFSQPGSYQLFNHPAGYPVFIVLGKDFILRGFHNVCRHRAYPVVSNRQSGCTPLLACGYHGWMYNLKGELVKAPKFDGVDGFRKGDNSLFEVHVRVDTEGVVWVNVGAVPEAQSELDVARSSRYTFDTWEVEGAFNWKIAGMRSFPITCPHGRH